MESERAISAGANRENGGSDSELQSAWCKSVTPLTVGLCFVSDDDRLRTTDYIDSHTRSDQTLFVGLPQHQVISITSPQEPKWPRLKKRRSFMQRTPIFPVPGPVDSFVSLSSLPIPATSLGPRSSPKRPGPTISPDSNGSTISTSSARSSKPRERALASREFPTAYSGRCCE